MSGELHPRPTAHDWLLLVIGIVFVACGLFILPHDPDTGIVTLAFFGSCLAVFVMRIAQKLRYRAFPGADQGATVSVAGGVPIKPAAKTGLLMSLWMMALGIILTVFGRHSPAVIRFISMAMVLFGAGLGFGILKGWLPGGFLQFDPDAFVIGHRGWNARLPWDAIAGVVQGEFHGNPVLLITANLETIEIVPSSANPKALKTIASNRTWTGADFMVMMTYYAIDLPLLAATVARYATTPAARSELEKRFVT